MRRGTKANPAYLPMDVDLLEKLIEQAYAAYDLRADPPLPQMFRFMAEHILGIYLDPPGKDGT